MEHTKESYTEALRMAANNLIVDTRNFRAFTTEDVYSHAVYVAEALETALGRANVFADMADALEAANTDRNGEAEDAVRSIREYLAGNALDVIRGLWADEGHPDGVFDEALKIAGRFESNEDETVFTSGDVQFWHCASKDSVLGWRVVMDKKPWCFKVFAGIRGIDDWYSGCVIGRVAWECAKHKAGIA